GKYKSVSCLYTGSPDSARFDSFPTDRTRLHKLLTRCQPAVVVIEACLLAGWVHDLCAALGLRCLVANTASEAWKFKHLKRKTDKDDALRLAQLYALGQLPTVALPPPATRQWRALIAYRQTLVGRRVAVQNRIRALFVAQGLPAPRGAKAWSATGLAGIATSEFTDGVLSYRAERCRRGRVEGQLTCYVRGRKMAADTEEFRVDLVRRRRPFDGFGSSRDRWCECQAIGRWRANRPLPDQRRVTRRA